MSRPLRLYIIAGEQSGDALGAALIRALKRRAGGEVRLKGVGGEGMAAAGLESLYPLSEVAVMGIAAVARRLPAIIKRVHETVEDAVSFSPDGVVIIDSPEFTHPIARRIRRRLPDVPIVDYVCPSVWAWRPGRARKMVGYIDRVLCLLPFEPAALEKLRGPEGTYVGHPLIEHAPAIRAADSEGLARRLGISSGRPVLVVLPGSRRSEVERLMQPFGRAVAAILAKQGDVGLILPVVESVRPLVETKLASWPARPHLVAGEADKFAAFALAQAALAASGTVTLELALAGSPMVVAYKVDVLSYQLRHFISAPSIVLANLILGENAFPEFIQRDCTPERLAEAVLPLLADSPERARQLAALSRIDARLMLAGTTPSEAAASAALETILAKKKKRGGTPVPA
ncbi:MAG: lipid-A-disaccharide synthase [Bauldia sp.]|nr:MAG: lipid-A-disaccharide synthase [Bauldia sp.]